MNACGVAAFVDADARGLNLFTVTRVSLSGQCQTNSRVNLCRSGALKNYVGNTPFARDAGETAFCYYCEQRGAETGGVEQPGNRLCGREVVTRV